jgi:DNA-binding NtrC family response regulator
MARSRSTTLSLQKLLGEAALPVYALDAERRIVFVNAALEAWLGVRSEDLVGLRCDFHTPPNPGPLAIAARLCPPPAALRGELREFMVASGDVENSSGARHARCLALGEAAALCEVLIIVVNAADAPIVALAESAADAAPALHARLATFRRQAAGRFGLDRLLGDSPAMQRVRRQVLMAMHAQSRTVIVGPPGTGREHVARSMHYAEDEAGAAPLMPLACPLVDAEMLQASITAFARRCRSTPSPRMGALLLLDVDELNAASQAELAGFLSIPGFDLHTLATARTSLLDLADRGTFRRDLALALSTLVITLPPLAERKEDVPLVAHAFLEQQNALGGKQIGGVSSAALDLLSIYHWPQNLDELAATMRQAHAACAGTEISPEDLPAELRLTADTHNIPRIEESPINLDELLAQIEDELIQRALARAKGNKTKAAELLGITRARLHRKLGED